MQRCFFSPSFHLFHSLCTIFSLSHRSCLHVPLFAWRLHSFYSILIDDEIVRLFSSPLDTLSHSLHNLFAPVLVTHEQASCEGLLSEKRKERKREAERKRERRERKRKRHSTCRLILFLEPLPTVFVECIFHH